MRNSCRWLFRWSEGRRQSILQWPIWPIRLNLEGVEHVTIDSKQWLAKTDTILNRLYIVQLNSFAFMEARPYALRATPLAEPQKNPSNSAILSALGIALLAH